MYREINGVIHDDRGPYQLESDLEIDWYLRDFEDEWPVEEEEPPDLRKFHRNDLYPEMD